MSETEIQEIRIRIHEEKDLYNPLDADQSTLSDDVIAYAEQKYSEMRELHRQNRICIISDLPVNEPHVREVFQMYILREEKQVARQQKIQHVKQMRLFLIGIIFITAWLALSAVTDNLLVEILSIIGSFAVWEAADIWIVETPEMRWQKRRLKRLEETEIRFCTAMETERQTHEI